MNILALDSSQEVLSAALAMGEDLWYSEINAGRRHSELMMDCVDWLFKSAGIAPNELNLVACMKGPGSFTGLRIAYAAAKGLAMALEIPLRAIPTLECMARHLSFWPGIVLPVIDAKQGRFFTALYREGKLLGPYMDASPETLIEEIKGAKKNSEDKIILTGSGAPLFKSLLPPEKFRPDDILLDPQYGRGRARELLEITKCVIIEEVNDLDSGPLYLRKSDAEQKAGKK